MNLRYEGPREEVAVLVEGVRVLHRRGTVLEYPEALGAELLEDPRNTFTVDTAATAPRAAKRRR